MPNSSASSSVSTIAAQFTATLEYNYRPQRLAVPPAPNKIKVYLPSAMAALATQLDNAINDWNARIAITSLAFERVGTACVAGPDCITVEVEDIPDGLGGYYCGHYSHDTPYWATGEHTGGLQLELSSTWASYSAAAQRRTFAHELGHFLGLNELSTTACAQSDAVMQPAFTCTSTSNPVAALTAADYVPVVSTVYGGHTKKSCGF
jgi:hypothetical protein